MEDFSFDIELILNQIRVYGKRILFHKGLLEYFPDCIFCAHVENGCYQCVLERRFKKPCTEYKSYTDYSMCVFEDDSLNAIKKIKIRVGVLKRLVKILEKRQHLRRKI